MALPRPYDCVLFGATGFTGRYVLKEILASYPPELSLAVAGRNAERLNALVAECQGAAGSRPVTVLPGVDVSDPASLEGMCASTRLVLSVVGPYRKYGEPVVAAAIKSGTDYLDVCGEPEFMERMESVYGEAAAAAGCYVASGAGFDSIPGDLGTVLAQRQFKSPSVPSSVEAFLSLTTGPSGYSAHYATWESAVLGIGSVGELRALRKAAKSGPPLAPAGPRPKIPSGVEFVRHPAVSSHAVPFPGADAAVVRRTQRALQARGQAPVHFTARFLMAHNFVLSIPVARGANWFLAGGGRRMDEEEATAAAAERIAAAAEDGTSLPVRLATDVVRFLYGGTGRREPADGGVVSASLLNAKPAVGGIGVEPRGGGVLRVLFTVASDAVADTVVRWRHELRRCVDSTAVFDVLSDCEEAQHQALWPAFLAAKVAGKRAQLTYYKAAAVGGVMVALAGTSWGRSLLLSAPGLFSAGAASHAGPTSEQAAAAGHAVTLVALGYSAAPPPSDDGGALQLQPDREVVLRVSGPDPGYHATAIYLAQAGLSLLTDRGQLPAPGVHTPGALLCDTSYPDRLRARGISIEVLSDGPATGSVV
ncbi:hypothetical protein FOA52_008565 [Chlamydomonas sp. UWO 241]|nr:hypothetical protein FOA52_008565 [Chlamydomonas sp. UWO 241]